MNELNLSEINDFIQISSEIKDFVRVKKLNEFTYNSITHPIHSLVLGPEDKTLPTLGLVGGVHGLERVGTQIILSYLHTLKQRLIWDKELGEQLKNRRIVILPVVNPWGMKNFRRSNHNGVDLMRNAPVDAVSPTFLVGGHRLGPFLPWYRGKLGGEMELESQTLINFLKEEVFPSKVSIVMDLHSGFGMKDQIWYPYAKSKEVFPFFDSFKRLEKLFVETYPHHVYNIEPQSKHYTTHGDLWDYALELQQQSEFHMNTFIPLTLELGSWNWVKKNPIQLFSSLGLFNPIKQHRYSRTMRRHLYLLDFLFKAIKNNRAWVEKSGAP